ncbi:MAG TPA: NRDE family protein [Alphaproteobacteria bacterium]|nr:NRDE family protein [Alphaproteobacteria bacterium]
MCTIVVLLRPGQPWPVLIAANRDEMLERPWKPPAEHWPDRPGVVAGLDVLAGGSWLGINREGVVAAALNRRHSLGPQTGMRSRGELVLEALDHADAANAAEALSAIDPTAYRTFNFVVADNSGGFWLRNLGTDGPGKVEPFPLAAGMSMITAFDLNDPASLRIRDNLPRFQAAALPDPDSGDWGAWQALLARRSDGKSEIEHEGDMCVVTDRGFGTSSSSLIALPSPQKLGVRPIWLFAPGRPDRTPFAPVPLR